MKDKGDFREIIISRDELTGLLDKQTFYDCAQDWLEKADEDSEFSFIFFDLDNFKIFNVNYGYEIGDELLMSLGYIIKDVFKDQLISRFSGDHFVVCTNSLQIIPSIKSIRDRIKLVQKSVNIELKAGIYVCNGTERDVIRCCDRARMACISIKKKYDTEYRFYDDELGGSLKRKQEILDGLDEAIEKKYIQVYFQPLVRTLTGKVCGLEALVRWNNPRTGMVYPNEFIPVLEEYRLIYKIDLYVMDYIFSKFNESLRTNGEIPPVSINLSRLDFEVVDIVEMIDMKRKQYNCPKDMFHFEITESALTENPQFILEQITRMRDKGYRVWMDDFGSGYSSLNVLKNFLFDLVKIDMGFLSEFDANNNGKIILRHIVSMIKDLNIHTLVEGVETEEQYEFLKSIGCEMVQGYFIGRPMPYQETFECIRNEGRKIESKDERYFYEELGKIDVLRQNPLANIEHRGIENPLPLAIVVCVEGQWKFRYTNKGFKSIFANFGLETMETMEKVLSSNDDEDWVQRSHFLDICRHSKSTHDAESMDFIERGRIVNLRVRHVCTNEDNKADAYLVSVRILSRISNTPYDDRFNEISRYLFSQYECVDLFGLDIDFFENIYLEDSRLHVDFKNKKPRTVIEMISNELVHPYDRPFYIRFFDWDTIKERIASEKAGSIIGFFRIKDVKGKYVWKSVNASIMHFDKYDALIVCIKETTNEMARQMYNINMLEKEMDENQNYFNANENSLVYKRIMEILPVGVFWKDTQRRFVGANQMFLDYYGFQSVEEIIGKTDEDMGWHINPEPFKNDELSVLNDGKFISNVRGECIVRGEVRQIVASKQPYVVNRKIAGLIGCFRDITDELQEQEKLELLSMTDTLTGLYNRRAFKKIVEKYIEQYKNDSSDFAIMMIDIDKFKLINDLYGHDIGDEVLKNTGRVLRHVAAESSVVFRYGGDEFVILHQQKNDAELDSIVQELTIECSNIKQISNINLTIRLSIGYEKYSTYENLNECIDKADNRMYMDKEKHKRG